MKIKRYTTLAAWIIGCSMTFSCSTYDVRHESKSEPVDREALIKRFQPPTVTECRGIEENSSLLIRRGADFCISELRAFENKQCQGTGETIAPGDKEKDLIFRAPLHDNYQCPETITVRRGSPCYLYEFDSGGTIYKLCYHDGRRVELNRCLRHTGVCGPPHNP
jgi:hypothetical protein